MTERKNLSRLTDREYQILLLVAKGWSNDQIAQELSLSVRTVKFHTGNIYSKLGVRTRSQAIAWAWEHADIRTSMDR